MLIIWAGFGLSINRNSTSLRKWGFPWWLMQWLAAAVWTHYAGRAKWTKILLVEYQPNQEKSVPGPFIWKCARDTKSLWQRRGKEKHDHFNCWDVREVSAISSKDHSWRLFFAKGHLRRLLSVPRFFWQLGFPGIYNKPFLLGLSKHHSKEAARICGMTNVRNRLKLVPWPPIENGCTLWSTNSLLWKITENHHVNTFLIGKSTNWMTKRQYSIANCESSPVIHPSCRNRQVVRPKTNSLQWKITNSHR